MKPVRPLAIVALAISLASPRAWAEGPEAAAPPPAEATPKPATIQSRIDAAKPGDVVELPAGRYSETLVIAKPLTLRGVGEGTALIDVKGDDPVVEIKGADGVVLENLMIVWSPMSIGSPLPKPAAVLITDAKVTLRDCQLAPHDNFFETPAAIMTLGRSELHFLDGQTRGFQIAVTFGDGVTGSVEDSTLREAGRIAVVLQPGSGVLIRGNILAKCGQHAVRNVGGVMDMRDNLVLENTRTGVYLGNKPGHGSIRENLFVGDGAAVAAFAESDAVIERNLILRSLETGLIFESVCRLVVRANVIGDNPLALRRTQKPGGDPDGGAKLEGNLYWRNGKEGDGVALETPTSMAGSLFADFNAGDFTILPEALPPQFKTGPPPGLSDPKSLKPLWERANAGGKKSKSPRAPEAPNTDAKPADAPAGDTPPAK